MQFDESVTRVAGMLRWLRVGSMFSACHFCPGESRGDFMTEATGITVHDDLRCYSSCLKNVLPDALGPRMPGSG